MSEAIYREPTKEEKIEFLKIYLKELHEELRNAKSYYTKLIIKQDISVKIRELKDLLK